MYRKIEGLRRMQWMGFNCHDFLVLKPDPGHDPCNRLKQTDDFAKQSGCRFTVRTDCPHGPETDLPFFRVDGFRDYMEKRPVFLDCLRGGLALILTDALRYDDDLIFNMVFAVDRDGVFRAEFSGRKVPLRHMYRYPEDLTNLTGNVNDPMCDWDISLAKDNRTDLRLVRDLAEQLYMAVRATGLWGHYLELSLYREPHGWAKEEIVFWQI